MKKEFRVSIVRPNRPEGLALLLYARSLNKAVSKLLCSADYQLPAGQYVVQETGNADNCVSISLTPALIAHLRIPRKEAETVNRYLQAKAQNEFQGEDDTISHTVVFPDGKQMDIKCCGAQDECSWTEAVLFNECGYELCCSEPSDRYDGQWELEYQNRRYVAFVHICK